MNSIYLSTYRYFDKTGGNTYFSSRLYIDGEEVARLPFQYGYETADQTAAMTALAAKGYTRPEMGQSLYSFARENDAVLYLSPLDFYTTAKAVKAYGKADN